MLSKRHTTFYNGLEVTEQSDTALSWRYYSEPLERTIEGTLTYTDAQGSGWRVDMDTVGLVVSAPLYLGTPQSLLDAIKEIQKMISRTEIANVKPDPRHEQRERELNDLFSGLYDMDGGFGLDGGPLSVEDY